MSGFEIVGIVLGALPLVISFAQNYKRVFRPLLKWIRFRADFINFINDVDFEMKKFNNTIESLLLSVNMTDEEIHRLMAKSDDCGWQGEVLEKRLKAKLKTSYNVFMSTMNTIAKLATNLQELLSLKDGEVYATT